MTFNPAHSIMAFVTASPAAGNLSHLGRAVTPRRPESRPIFVPNKTVRMDITPPRGKTRRLPPVQVKRARKQDELDQVFNVWNAVAETEDLPTPVLADDNDNAQSTIHIYAHAEGQPDVIVGAARLLLDGQNARLDRVSVLPAWRGRGVGRSLVNKLLSLTAGITGAIYVEAKRGGEMGFFSILGFESVGNDRLENGVVVRTMLYRVPMCAPSAGCVGLHHASLRVSDIERSLAFYGSVGFIVEEKFLTSNGSRACFVEGLGTRLEFVESKTKSGGIAGVQGIPPTGFDRLVFDVTKACTDLDSYLQHLERRNGGQLQILGPPSTQIVGNCVMSVASISDPDGLPIEFFRREAQVPWELRTRVKW